MNSTLSKILIFAAGAAIGSAVTWKLIKTKYEQIANEEIESVKEFFGKDKKEEESESEKYIECGKALTEGITDGLKEVEKICEENGYTNYSNVKKEEEEMDIDAPYVIAPEEFGELDDYETETLTYYKDKVLADDWDNKIENVDDLVGEESLTHFGEYEEDSVYVRNDTTKTDYEILLDERNFSDVRPTEG